MEVNINEWTYWNRKDDGTCCLDGCYCNDVNGNGCESCPVTICYCHYDDGCPNE